MQGFLTWAWIAPPLLPYWTLGELSLGTFPYIIQSRGQWLLPSSSPSSVIVNSLVDWTVVHKLQGPPGIQEVWLLPGETFFSRSSLELRCCCCPALPFGADAEAAPWTTWGFLFPLQDGKTIRAHMWYGKNQTLLLGIPSGNFSGIWKS